MWEWSTPKAYLHDAISTDKRNPRVNANGLIYGSPEGEHRHGAGAESDHQHGDAAEASLSRSRHALHRKTFPRGHSPYWGDEPIWDGHTSIHNPLLDEKGRVWFTARIRSAPNPDFCKAGSDHPSAKVVPLNQSVRQLSMYDPKTGKWSLIDTCFSTQHLYFAKDANNTLWTSAGGPDSGVVGWLNTKMYEQTGDEVKSQGWTPLILDTNGNGKRDEYVEADQPLDPKKDKRIMAAFYGVQPSPVDDSIWGQSMDVGFSRIDQPGYIIRLVPGSNPSQTALAEVYLPPDIGYGSRGIDLDLNGVVWTTLSSGHLASFDRRKCKGPLNGPAAATGKQCPEGWTLYQFPGPQFKGVTDPGSADHAYFLWVDRYNTLGLGPNVPIAEANGSESLLALVNGKFVNIHIPYPDGFLQQERGWPHRRSQHRLERAGTVDHTRHTRVLPQRRGRPVAAQSLSGPDASRSARAVSLFTFTDNILTAYSGYNPIHLTAHLWTISYEEQFYLVIPVLLLFLFRSSRARVVTCLLASAAVLVVVRAVLIHLLRTPHPAIWVLPVTHFESIILGIVVGLGGFDVLFSRIPAILVLTSGLFWLARDATGANRGNQMEPDDLLPADRPFHEPDCLLRLSYRPSPMDEMALLQSIRLPWENFVWAVCISYTGILPRVAARRATALPTVGTLSFKICCLLFDFLVHHDSDFVGVLPAHRKAVLEAKEAF